MKTKEQLIRETLIELGLEPSYKGFDYICYGLILLLEDKKLLTRMTKGLYQGIADHFEAKTACVERNIRTVRDEAWDRSKEGSRWEGYRYCPTNGEFFDFLLHKMERKLSDKKISRK